MTRKNYIAIAQILGEGCKGKTAEQLNEYLEMVDKMMGYLWQDNNAFDRQRFIDAVMESSKE